MTTLTTRSKVNRRRPPRFGIADDALLRIHHLERYGANRNQQIVLVAVGIEGFPIILEAPGLLVRVVHQPRDSINRHVRLVFAVKVIEGHARAAPNFRYLAAPWIRPEPHSHLVVGGKRVHGSRLSAAGSIDRYEGTVARRCHYFAGLGDQ